MDWPYCTLLNEISMERLSMYRNFKETFLNSIYSILIIKYENTSSENRRKMSSKTPNLLDK